MYSVNSVNYLQCTYYEHVNSVNYELVCGQAVCGPYHFNDIHLRLNPQLVQEHSQVLLHLDAVVIHLGNGKYPYLAGMPYFVLMKEKW